MHSLRNVTSLCLEILPSSFTLFVELKGHSLIFSLSFPSTVQRLDVVFLLLKLITLQFKSEERCFLLLNLSIPLLYLFFNLSWLCSSSVFFSESSNTSSSILSMLSRAARFLSPSRTCCASMSAISFRR